MKAELPDAWLGGRQKAVLTNAIAAALAAARRAEREECAKEIEGHRLHSQSDDETCVGECKRFNRQVDQFAQALRGRKEE